MAQTAALSAKEAEEAQQASSSVVRPAGLGNAGASSNTVYHVNALNVRMGFALAAPPIDHAL